jgi:hypothetical protein
MEMNRWLLPGAGAFAVLGAIAVAVIVIASPFDSDGESAPAQTESDTTGDTDGSMNMCVEGVPDCDDMVVDPSDGGGLDARDAAIRALADRLGVEPASVDVISSEAVDWPDACLGVQQPGVLCAQVITAGYKIVLEQGGTQYEYHTDLAGHSVAAD